MSKLTPFILLIFSGLIFFWFISPKYEEVKALRVEEKRYDEVLSKAKALLAKREALQEKYRSISKDDITKLNTMLPDSLNNIRLVLDMDRMAFDRRLSIKGIAVSQADGTKKTDASSGPSGNNQSARPATGGPLYGTATLSFSVSAPYNTFLQFLRDMEDGLRLIDVTSLSVKPSDTGVYDYGVTFNTYWLK